MHASALGSGVANYRGGPDRNMREVKDPFPMEDDDWGLRDISESLDQSSHKRSGQVVRVERHMDFMLSAQQKCCQQK